MGTENQKKSWGTIINSILIIILMFWQGCTQLSLYNLEKDQSPLEEIFPIYTIKVINHENISDEYTEEIVFEYSGEKSAYYFISWEAMNSVNNIDNILSKEGANDNKISPISKNSGMVTIEKNFEFDKADTYTIKATIHYLNGEPLGSTLEEKREFIKLNGKSKDIERTIIAGKQ